MRIRRLVWGVVLGASAALTVAIAALWVRSSFSGDYLTRASQQLLPPLASSSAAATPLDAMWRLERRAFTARHDRGSLWLAWTSYTSYRDRLDQFTESDQPPAWGYQAFPPGMPTRRVDAHFNHILDWSMTGLGFYTASKSGEDARVIEVPYALVLAVAAAPLAWAGWRAWRTRRRVAAGRCGRCGYDVRGAEVCAECGAAVRTRGGACAPGPTGPAC